MKKMMEKVVQQQMHTVSVVGLSKNAGKTTVLNALIRAFAPSINLVSIGIDGEEHDAWSGREKPLIYVPRGACVATAGTWLDLYPGNWEVLLATGVFSTAGEVFIARALQDTQVKLIGVNSTEGIRTVIQCFEQLGSVLTLVDGAYDRKVGASPFLTDGCILVVGASAQPSLAGVVEKADEWIKLTQLPVNEEAIVSSAMEVAKRENCLVGVVGGSISVLPFTSLLVLTEREIKEQLRWDRLIVPGALTDRLLQKWITAQAKVTMVVPDLTHLFLSLPILRRFQRMGGNVEVQKQVKMVGVAINPVSPEGYSFSPVEMREQITAICEGIPVVDVVREEGGDCSLMEKRDVT